MKNKLFLASGSFGRKRLLQEAQIPFEIIAHTADESACSLDQPLDVVVTQLAVLKMNHITLPQGHENQIIFVLTADTLTLDSHGKLLGKPQDRVQAIAMLQNRNSALVGSGFCLDKKELKNGIWHTVERIVDYDHAWVTVDVPDAWIDTYLKKIPYLLVSGSVSIGEYGEQFVKEVRGNYSSIIGMPMFKLRQALQKIGFYEC